MIIFVSNPNLIPVINNKSCKPCVIYNLSSLYSGYKDITYLMTNMRNVSNPYNIPLNVFVDMPEFDISYGYMVTNDQLMFTLFMDVMQCNFIGMDAIILVHRDPYRDAVMESIIKMIQYKYGINAWIVESVEDVDCIKESLPNPCGILALDADLSKYNDNIQHGVINNPVVTYEACAEL